MRAIEASTEDDMVTRVAGISSGLHPDKTLHFHYTSGPLSRSRRSLTMFLTVHMPDGAAHRLEALDGWRVMEVIRDWGLPSEAVRRSVRLRDLPRLGRRGVAGEARAADLGGARDARRCVQCRRALAALLPDHHVQTLDGLEVELAPESLADAPAERLVMGG